MKTMLSDMVTIVIVLMMVIVLPILRILIE
jgi:hypothetical protein